MCLSRYDLNQEYVKPWTRGRVVCEGPDLADMARLRGEGCGVAVMMSQHREA